MIKDTNVIFRINSTLKKNVTRIANNRGVSLSELINACLMDIDRKGSIPLHINRFLPPVYEKENKVTIAKIKKILNEIVEKNEKLKLVRKLYLYGSYSRGEETPESDIDLRMEADRGLTLVDLENFRQAVVDLTGKEVDLSAADPEDLDASFYSSIKKDEICIYERR